MQKTSLSLLLVLFVLLCPSCKKCIECNDPLLVKVPAAGFGNIHYQWEISNAVTHSNNTVTSSISIIPSGTTTVNVNIADSIVTTLYLNATDTIAGIKCIRINGGFGYTCSNNAGLATIYDGILPKFTACENLTKCCFRNQTLKINDISQYMKCTGMTTPNFSNGSIGLTGIIENCLGNIDTVFLSVEFH